MNYLSVRLAGTLLMFLVAPGVQAALVINAGQLTGATDVNIGGTLYNVEFVDGTCVALFDGCNELSDFTFISEADALAASQALLDQVLLDGGSGNFDSQPNLTFGCSDSTSCTVFTPYNVVAGSLSLGGAQNAVNDNGDAIVTSVDVFGSSADLAAVGPDAVYARWTVVPIPAAAWLFASGLGLLGWMLRKRS